MEVSPYELKTALNEALQKGEVSITCILYSNCLGIPKHFHHSNIFAVLWELQGI